MGSCSGIVGWATLLQTRNAAGSISDGRWIYSFYLMRLAILWPRDVLSLLSEMSTRNLPGG
jgi:hypothetical protein